MESLLAKKSKSRPIGSEALALDHVSPATRLLEKRRQTFEVQDALDHQKEEFARKEEAFAARESALRAKVNLSSSNNGPFSSPRR